MKRSKVYFSVLIWAPFFIVTLSQYAVGDVTGRYQNNWEANTMDIDPQTQAILDAGKDGPGLHELAVEDARGALKAMTALHDIAETDVFKRTERTIPGPNGEIPVRIYWPRQANEGETFPILLLFHGGGFALGDMDTHENVARYYSVNADAIVINVDYRLSPEHKFPAGIEDSYAALEWVSKNASDLGGDANRIAVTGDSAGGNIAAVVSQMAKARSGPKVAFQALVYPVVMMDLTAQYQSIEEFGGGEYFLSLQDMTWINGMYFNTPQEARHLLASPILEEDLSDLPPALVITAGYDPLRDQGEDYANQLRAAGVPVDYVCFGSTIHGFMAFGGSIDVGKEGLALVVKSLREAFNKPS